MPVEYDIAIVGAGFGGALLAQIARRLGRTVLLIEAGRHPRFAIGESTSPLMNLLLEQLAVRYDLPRLLPLTTYGAWQRAYPTLGCGLKRGFTYFHQESGKPYRARSDRSNQLMVAASPNEEVADTHWLRADVDFFLVQEAIAQGADYQDETRLQSAEWMSDGIGVLSGERRGQPFQARARFIVDATGPRGFLSRALPLPESDFAGYPPTQSLYSHFSGVHRCDSMPDYRVRETPPYPLDAAALHHVFDGGWMWVLRFNTGVTSAGIAVTAELAEELRLWEGEAAWSRFLARFPTVAAQFAEAKAIRPFTYALRLAYRAGVAAGEGWALLPSAASFIDPLFSTGMPLTLLGIERLARLLAEAWGRSDWNLRLAEYSAVTLAEADGTAQFISGCYAAMPQFPLFSAFSMFYFAASSYSEMARRLERPHLARRFLATDRADFTQGLRESHAWLLAQRLPCSDEKVERFQESIGAFIAPLNIAGLNHPAKSNWYGVDLNDLIAGANALEISSEDMRRVLATAAWT